LVSIRTNTLFDCSQNMQRQLTKLRLSNALRSRRRMSTNNNKHKKNKNELAAASVTKSKTNPKVADAAAATKELRTNASGGGGGAGVGVLLAGGVLGGTGYTAYKLKSDASFAATLNNWGLGNVVDGFGKLIPLAKEEQGNARDAKDHRVTTTTPVDDASLEKKPPPMVSTASTDATTSESMEGVGNTSTEENDAVKETKEAEEIQQKLTQTPEEARTDAQENAVAAVVASNKVQEQAEEDVQQTLNDAQADAVAVDEMKASPSEKERLREEVLSIERSVSEQQGEVRRDTVAQLRVREAQLRGTLEDMLARDLSEANVEELRRRVVSLVMELQERNQSEAAQLIAVLENAEQKASKKSVEALRKQSETYDELVRVSLREQEVQLQDDYAKRLDEYITESTLRIQHVSDDLNKAHAQDLDTKLALSRAEQDAEIAAITSEEHAASYARANAMQAARVATVEDLRLKLQALDKVFQINAEYLSNSHQIHLVSTALLALYNSLSANGGTNRRRTSLSEAVASLRVAARADPVIVSALESLPKAAMAGVSTLSELEIRFTNAREESRKALYTPEGTGVVGHALGSVAAGLTVAPTFKDVEGGEGGDGTEACLARAHHYISSGNVRSALQEVKRIDGDAAAVMVDWVDAAETRLLVEQAVQMIGAHVTTLVATLS
jgi:hypothetical protein